MNPPPTRKPHKRPQFPAEKIGHGVWLSFRFCLNDRDVDALMAERGVILVVAITLSPLPAAGRRNRWSCGRP